MARPNVRRDKGRLFEVGLPDVETLKRLKRRLRLRTENDVQVGNDDRRGDAYMQLAQLLFDPERTSTVVEMFRCDLLNILEASRRNGIELDYNHDKMRAMTEVMLMHPDAEKYALEYFKSHPCPFEMDENDVDIAEISFYCLRYKPAVFRAIWPWRHFFARFDHHTAPRCRWLASQCLAIIVGMPSAGLRQIIAQRMDQEVAAYWENYYSMRPYYLELNTREKMCLFEDYEEPNVVKIEEIILRREKATTEDAAEKKKLILVPSTRQNLYRTATGVAMQKAVHLEGEVGAGKTALVEYLAARTNRVLGVNFIKVQLGDQTDSKTLLGTYKCTDIPGEFVWQAGVLTQAVVDGAWLLLEDIDSASMDVASVIGGLLEQGRLSVAGYKDNIPIADGFQLFTTQRLLKSSSGIVQRKHSNAVGFLEKYVHRVTVAPLHLDELESIIVEYYPPLTTIATRMIRVYNYFVEQQWEAQRSRLDRAVSTRDLFKWCRRTVDGDDYNVSSEETALCMLQHAMDIFCASLADAKERLRVSEEICAVLGIVADKARYYWHRHQPVIQTRTHAESNVERLHVGRTWIPRAEESCSAVGNKNFCFTQSTMCLVERIVCGIKFREPVLLVGETGTGKTTTVQYIADAVGRKLIVINMNQQSDSTDLLGGYKPVDRKLIIAPIRREFEAAFCNFYNVEKNRRFLANINHAFNESNWYALVQMMKKSYMAAWERVKQVGDNLSGATEKQRQCYNDWLAIREKILKLEAQLTQKNALAFAFIEGSLVKAVREGHWVLLDEINLANDETLECLSGLLEDAQGSLSLSENGEKMPVRRHPDFTLFACMNPSTDVGKKDLPVGLRNRFTEFFVDELTDRNDLIKLVHKYFETLQLPAELHSNIVRFYLQVRREASESLSDGVGHKPHFSLRSLCRAMAIAAKNPCGKFKRSLYEAFCLSFLTQLDSKSYTRVENMIRDTLIPDVKLRAVLKEAIPCPDSDKYLEAEGYWIEKGPLECQPSDQYILTESVRSNLRDIARIVSIGKLPILLQGDTSVGKTSLISYLAKTFGYKCVRINNHEHTDLQEYIGTYVATETGTLQFCEGLLVQAMRQGHWIILDELNLAPSDVLEALNRVLDDNREIFIAETQQVVKAHPNFMLFATQNPPGAYGGRKMLSRAFRNRFVELHFNEIPRVELETILHQRCSMPESYAKKMIAVMHDLQMRRRGSAAFAGKKGFITLRDLFRWGERYRLAGDTPQLYDWNQHVADEGYLLLAGRVRQLEEKEEIALVLKKHFKREVNPENLFTLSENTSKVTAPILEKILNNSTEYPNIVWTYNMRQLAVLVTKAQQFREPVLLVGDTGGGKTTVCQIIAMNNKQELVTVNCHMHTESGDFIGALRPVREHNTDDGKFFQWVNGPLVTAMQQGAVFLADEISLADDSVIERLNSLLEPERTLLLAEKGSEQNELIIAHDAFHFIGTMNPGGDFGKKELSPALRNRFTEIWCERCDRRADLIAIIDKNITDEIKSRADYPECGLGIKMIEFIDFVRTRSVGKLFTISIRDLLTWTQFINATVERVGVPVAYANGASLTLLDSLGSGNTGDELREVIWDFNLRCQLFIHRQWTALCKEITFETLWTNPFHVDDHSDYFDFKAPTTALNMQRLMRGLQLSKPLLLEGSPGVGKTSLVEAVAEMTGDTLLRINLSDQTDISDLFGADLPVEGGLAGHFAWRDGPLLRALKQGHWVLLDELNLASQSVLEGLNACFDHRGEIYVPELSKAFTVPAGTRFFACQNPLRQGGSRRGLPQSFLNRFTQVHLGDLTNDDLIHILQKRYGEIPLPIILRMISFRTALLDEMAHGTFGSGGGPWEFNLRDLCRWCEGMLYLRDAPNAKLEPGRMVSLIFGARLRGGFSEASAVAAIYGAEVQPEAAGACFVSDTNVRFGDVVVQRCIDGFSDDSVREQDNFGLVLRGQLAVFRGLALCVNLKWMPILVGPAGSGKSSVVKTFAKLIGRRLRIMTVTAGMDTTDLLGGFEQADYTRHWEEMVADVNEIFMVAIRHYYLTATTNAEYRECFPRWELFTEWLRKESDKKCDTMAEATRAFLKRLDNLLRIIGELNARLDYDELAALVRRLDRVETRCKQLTDLVQREGSLNAGGKFEWVDSMLIKCLRDGAWLLIDNVNLCSPAVLDRLNALLEPKGVLTIGERGVNDEGEMITIAPHPDFRLFLTMDPKNGEISRAMRNRGVEIFISGSLTREGESRLTDSFSLIASAGIKDENIISAIIFIYVALEKADNNVHGINRHHLMRMATLMAAKMARGTTRTEAFQSTVRDVFEQFFAPEVITRALAKYESVVVSNLDLRSRFYSEHAGLPAKMISNNAHMAMACYHGNIPRKYQELIRDFEALRRPYDYMSIIFFLLMSTPKDVVQHLVYFGQELAPLYKRTYTCNKVKYDEIAQKLIKILRKMTNPDIEFEEVPYDPRFVTDTDWFATPKSVSLSNRLMLILAAFMHVQMHEHNISCPVDEEVTTTGAGRLQKRTFSILNYCVSSYYQGSALIVDHPVLNNVLTLFTTFDIFFMNIMANEDHMIDDELVFKLLQCLKYRWCLYEYLQRHVEAAVDISLYISELNLRYRWFRKHSFDGIVNLLNINIGSLRSGDECISKCVSLLGRIDAELGNVTSRIQKLCKRFQKSYPQKKPLRNNLQIMLVPFTHDIFDTSDVCNRQQDIFHAIKLAKNERERLLSMSVGLHYDLPDVEGFAQWEFMEIPHDMNRTAYPRMSREQFHAYTVIDYYNVLTAFEKRINISVPCVYPQDVTVPLKLDVLDHFYLDNGIDSSRELELRIELHYFLRNALSKSMALISTHARVAEATMLPLESYMPMLSALMANCYFNDFDGFMVAATLQSHRSVARASNLINLAIWANMSSAAGMAFDYVESERKYLHVLFEEFITHLTSALRIENDLVGYDTVLQTIAQTYQEYNEAGPLYTILESVLSAVQQSRQDHESDTRALSCIADGLMAIGYSSCYLSGHLPAVDPFRKQKIRKAMRLWDYNIYMHMSLGLQLTDEQCCGLRAARHPMHKKVELLYHQHGEDDIDPNEDMRPASPTYDTILTRLNQAFTGVLAPEKILDTMVALNGAMLLAANSNHYDLMQYRQQYDIAKSTLCSVEAFLRSLRNSQRLYPDQLERFVLDVHHFAYGLRLKICVFAQTLAARENQLRGIDAERVLSDLVRMPVLTKATHTTTYFDWIREYLSEETKSALVQCGYRAEDGDDSSIVLLRCAITDMRYACQMLLKTTFHLDTKAFGHLNCLLGDLVTAWREQQRAQEAARCEEESLYKFKKITAATDEELADEHFTTQFSNFYTDFEDFARANTLDDEPEEPEVVEAHSSKFSKSNTINEDDLLLLAQTHAELMLKTRNEWYKPEQSKPPNEYDNQKSFEERFKIFSKLIKANPYPLWYKMDKVLVGSLLYLTSITEERMDLSNNKPLQHQTLKESTAIPGNIFNFYKHQCPSAIHGLPVLLGDLSHTINHMLQTFIEHPTLLNIKVIIQRLLSFEFTSPVSRFLTGLDILLSKCHEWEQNAHSGVSLIDHIKCVSDRMIEWRQLELRCWSHSLSAIHDQLACESLAKYWCHMYDVMHEFIFDGAFTAEELITVLHTFIKQATMADFNIRLVLLEVFALHASYLEPTTRRDEYISVMWNIHKYYLQFLVSYQDHLKSLRQPIEVRLKNFVKIVRWRDISYWAVKETMDKTQKTIHKFMREYQQILKQSILCVIQRIESNPKSKDLSKTQMNLAAYIAQGGEYKSGLHTKIDATYARWQRVYENMMAANPFLEMIEKVDLFVGDVIETSQHLRSLAVDRSLEKTKQVAQAKSHLMQKRRSLADLFQLLTKMGLSFRKGIVEADAKKRGDADDLSEFTVRPLYLSPGFSCLPHWEIDNCLIDTTRHASEYQLKLHIRVHAMAVRMKTPAPDLSLGNLERCRGFALHLKQLALEQKIELGKTSHLLYKFRYADKLFAHIIAQRCVYVPVEWMRELQQTVTNGFAIVLDMEKCTKKYPTLELIGARSMNHMCYPKESERDWAEVHQTLEALHGKILYFSKLLHDAIAAIWVPDTCGELADIMPKFMMMDPHITECLQAIISKFERVEKAVHGLPAFTVVEDLVNTLRQFTEPPTIDLTTDLDRKTLKTTAMRTVGEIWKRLYSVAERFITMFPANAANTETISDKHLMVILESISKQMDLMQCEEVWMHIHRFLKIIQLVDWTEKNTDVMRIIKYVSHFVDKYTKHYHFLVVLQARAWCVTGKMASVLLGIFNDLIAQGFCVPSDLEAEVKEEMSKTMNGMGLGDGEGEKDVSDRIESEDQLDDAQAPGQEKSAEEDKDCKEEEKGIEMSEDFDSKLQDVEKKPEDEDGENESDGDGDSDADEQMGETDKGAEQQDKQTWGSDDEEEEGDGEEKEEENGKSGEKEGEPEMSAREKENPDAPGEDEKNQKGEGEQKEKEINEMKDPEELDDQQVDPYHGNQPELPEPEPMDLPDDMQLDSDGDAGDQDDEENPMDIDAMKENMPERIPEDKEQTDDNSEKDKDQSDDDDETNENKTNQDIDANNEEDADDANIDEETQTRDHEECEEGNQEEPEETDNSTFDQSKTQDSKAQAMDAEQATAADNVEMNQNDNQKSAPVEETASQEDNPDKEGVGQSQIEKSRTGHQGEANARLQAQNDRQQSMKEKKRNRPGETDTERTLGDNTQPVQKKLKTIDAKKNEQEAENDEEENTSAEADVYQHIKDAKTSSTQVMDAVTEEQAENLDKEQQLAKENEEEKMETDDDQAETEDLAKEDLNGEDGSPEDRATNQTDSSKTKKQLDDKNQGDVVDDTAEMEVDGDLVQSMNVQRSNENTFHTTTIPLTAPTDGLDSSQMRINALRQEVEDKLSSWHEIPNEPEAAHAWEQISSLTRTLAQDLSEKLRLILEPTQASHLQGDFRTGRRINMRKVIPYIASEFRKDKIWLRRTKPSKRDYQIVLAIDDSSSMADNHSRELAFESVSLIAKALALLESGQLSVLSFGETTRVVHRLTDPFAESSGANILQQFRFDQTKTHVAQMVNFANEMLNMTAATAQSLIAKLLIVVSDGRGIYSEGTSQVQRAVRMARLNNLFMIFVIVDNPTNQSSILDIRRPLFVNGKVAGIDTYMDTFPFPFYIILRDINALPSILSDALRQWFEIVSSSSG